MACAGPLASHVGARTEGARESIVHSRHTDTPRFAQRRCDAKAKSKLRSHVELFVTVSGNLWRARQVPAIVPENRNHDWLQCLVLYLKSRGILGIKDELLIYIPNSPTSRTGREAGPIIRGIKVARSSSSTTTAPPPCPAVPPRHPSHIPLLLNTSIYPPPRHMPASASSKTTRKLHRQRPSNWTRRGFSGA